MSTLAPPAHVPAAPQPVRRRGTLALAMQEALTAGARLRANRQVAADADSFRAQIKHLLGRADQEARAVGYDPADVKLAIYGFIAFLDESVLTSRQPMFAGWARQPLQEEIFGDHRAGEQFFVHLDHLLSRPETDALADVLEVFQLCMLLGFRGRYGAGEDGGLRTRMQSVHQKIERIRGRGGSLSPAAALPPGDLMPSTKDPWLPRLVGVTGTMTALAVILFVLFSVLLAGQVRELGRAASGDAERAALDLSSRAPVNS